MIAARAKIKEEEKKRRLRAQRSNGADHSLIGPLDHIYVVIDKGLYRQPEPVKGDRTRRDIKRNCAFHKDIGHNTERCVALKDDIKRLIRAGNFKDFIDEP